MRSLIIRITTLCILIILSYTAFAELDWKRDPFILPQVERSPSSILTIKCPSTIQLEGVLSDDDVSQAFISGDIYSVGDSINGFQILSISNERIVLKSKKYQCTLRIKSSEV